VGDAVRNECGEVKLGLGIGAVSGIVSPDARHLAYWTAGDLRVIDVAPMAQPKTLLSVKEPEYALYIAWSSDGTGVVVGVNGGGTAGVDAPPGYTALRVAEVSGGQPREIARIKNANVIPLAWDRQAHLIAGYEPSGGGARSYYVIDEVGTVNRSDAGPGLYIVEASGDGRYVFGRGEPASVVRVWPRGSYASGITIPSKGNQPIIAAAWRPGTSQFGVLVENRIELWDASGAGAGAWDLGHPMISFSRGQLVFRADGKTVFAVAASGEIFAIDIATGSGSSFTWSGSLPAAGSSVRLD
jgi:hypothetical protein